MKSETVIEGVAAERNGQYWGLQYSDGYGKIYGFGDLQNARIGDPEYTEAPTSFTWTPYEGWPNHDYHRLKEAKLVRIKKTIIIETEEL